MWCICMIECNFPVEMCFPLVMQYNIQAKGGGGQATGGLRTGQLYNT